MKRLIKLTLLIVGVSFIHYYAHQERYEQTLPSSWDNSIQPPPDTESPSTIKLLPKDSTPYKGNWVDIQ